MINILKDNDRMFLKNNIPKKYISSYYMKVNSNISAVFLPLTTTEVSSIVKYCYENNIAYLIHSAGTGAVGG